MDLSPIGEAALIAREGRRLEAYKDSVGIWTIGVGHTAAAGPPTPRVGLRITAAECDAIFARGVQKFVKTVRDAVSADLPQHAFDALVSLCFNIGQPALTTARHPGGPAQRTTAPPGTAAAGLFLLERQNTCAALRECC